MERIASYTVIAESIVTLPASMFLFFTFVMFLPNWNGNLHPAFNRSPVVSNGLLVRIVHDANKRVVASPGTLREGLV